MANLNDQMGLTIGGYVKKLILLKISSAIMHDNQDKQKEAEKFRYLFDAHFTSEVSAVAGKRQKLRRLNKPEDLPEESDMSALNAYVKKQILDSTADQDTVRLSKVVLAYLILFNKRRPSEVAEITTVSYLAEAYRNINDNQEILKSLSVSERLMSKRFVRDVG